MKTPVIPLAALAACLGIAGCAGALKSAEPAPLVYRVFAPELPGGDAFAADLLVAMSTTAPGLDSRHIATRWPDRRFDFYAGARWAAPLPAMVQLAVIESLQGARRLRSVQGDSASFRATHVLALEIRRFEADYTAGATPVARVELAATLGRQSDRRVLASWSVATRESAAANRLTEVVAALDAAFGQAVTETAARCFDAIGEDLARQPEAPPPR